MSDRRPGSAAPSALQHDVGRTAPSDPIWSVTVAAVAGADLLRVRPQLVYRQGSRLPFLTW